MVMSMTGFGNSRRESDKYSVNVEVKTVNHRFCEFSFRMPRFLSKIEENLKKTLSRHIQRGRAEVLITVEGSGHHEKTLKVDWQLLDEYFRFASEAGGKYGFEPIEAFRAVLGRDEFIHIEEQESENEELYSLIIAAADEAGERARQMRMAEGSALKADLEKNLSLCLGYVNELIAYAPSVTENYRLRLAARMSELLDKEVDQARLLAEVALFADKSDIHEELARLQSHISQFSSILESTEPIGRKLDFLVQEMNREVNTIGSKANDSSISRRVVELKSLLEKLKEQVQNIE